MERGEQLRLGQEMRLQQGLSPLQVRYGQLLEMNGPEVEEEVRREVDDNPALATVDADASAQTPWYRLQSPGGRGDTDSYEPQIADETDSLADSLERQLGELPLTDLQHLTALYVIGNIDSNGYITRPAASIATDMALSAGEDVETADVEAALAVVRRLDPPGVGAADLRDCLVLQLERRIASGDNTDATRLALTMVREHYTLFSRMHWDRLAQALGVDEAALREALDVVRTLNPKPGASVGDTGERPVVPDFLVETDTADDPDGEPRLDVTLLNNIPELQVTETFREGDRPSRRDRQASAAADFVSRKRREAEAFMSLLKMRRDTLMRIMGAIVTLQRQFFVSGDKADLKPMVLRDVAALTGDDLSVISRATAGKYVATDSGIYPLKMLFSERPKDDDDSVSLHRILSELQALVDREDPASPMSDDALAAALGERGLEVARRTVAKYREKLGIPVARLRKKL